MAEIGLHTASYVMDINGYQKAPWPELVKLHQDRFGPAELDRLLERIAGLGVDCVELWLGHAGHFCKDRLWKQTDQDPIQHPDARCSKNRAHEIHPMGYIAHGEHGERLPKPSVERVSWWVGKTKDVRHGC